MPKLLGEDVTEGFGTGGTDHPGDAEGHAKTPARPTPPRGCHAAPARTPAGFARTQADQL